MFGGEFPNFSLGATIETLSKFNYSGVNFSEV